MVLSVGNADHSKCALISPTQKVEPGTRVSMSGKELPNEHPSVLNPKKKIWERASPFLVVKDCFATYNDIPLKAGTADLKTKFDGQIG